MIILWLETRVTLTLSFTENAYISYGFEIFSIRYLVLTCAFSFYRFQ